MPPVEPLFDRVDDHFVARTISVSPWDRVSLNGAAVGGLLGMAIGDFVATSDLDIARLTIDILGTVPNAPLAVQSFWVRQGRQMALATVELTAGARVVARAQALLVRHSNTPTVARSHGHPAPATIAETLPFSHTRFGGQIATKRIYGAPLRCGPAAIWACPCFEIVAGTPLAPLARAALFADTCSGVGNVLERADWSYPNLDIVLNFLRLPRGEWLLSDAISETAGNGRGLARATLGDEDGIFAYAFQTVFITPAAPRPSA